MTRIWDRKGNILWNNHRTYSIFQTSIFCTNSVELTGNVLMAWAHGETPPPWVGSEPHADAINTRPKSNLQRGQKSNHSTNEMSKQLPCTLDPPPKLYTTTSVADWDAYNESCQPDHLFSESALQNANMCICGCIGPIAWHSLLSYSAALNWVWSGLRIGWFSEWTPGLVHLLVGLWHVVNHDGEATNRNCYASILYLTCPVCKQSHWWVCLPYMILCTSNQASLKA